MQIEKKKLVWNNKKFFFSFSTAQTEKIVEKIVKSSDEFVIRFKYQMGADWQSDVPYEFVGIGWFLK